MRKLVSISALVFGAQLHASDFHVVVRTTDAEIITVSMICPGDSALVVTNQYVERKPGSASWRAVGGVPPYRLVQDEPGEGGIVCFTVVDATGREARGCGVIGELRSSRFVGCNGGRSDGIPPGAGGTAAGVAGAAAGAKSQATMGDEGGKRPRVVKRSDVREDPVGGRPPVLREERVREVQPTAPPPRQKAQEGRGTEPAPAPQGRRSLQPSR